MISDQFSYLQTIEYEVNIGGAPYPMVAVFNCNKIPTGQAVESVIQDKYNRYVITMREEQFKSVFLDDNDSKGVDE